jgi:hypothetical protein
MSGKGRGMYLLFISYRRSDSCDITDRIYDRLKDVFGRDAIFKDIHSIPLGIDFRDFLITAVQQCQIQLVIIGPTWLQAADREGNQRLTHPSDWVRIEIEAALCRPIPVIPVLVKNATLPLPDELPPSIRELAYRNATKVRPDPDFHRDVDRLINGIWHLI